MEICFTFKKNQDIKILKGLSRKEFYAKFGKESLCLSFLSSVKWSESFSFIKCKNTRFSKGRNEFNRCCTKCGYDESPTANTLFYKVKFGIVEAFEMAYDI